MKIIVRIAIFLIISILLVINLNCSIVDRIKGDDVERIVKDNANKRYGIFIGISDYNNLYGKDDGDLKYADDDAEDMYEHFKTYGSMGEHNDEIENMKLFVNSEATAKNINNHLAKLKDAVEKGKISIETLIFYYAGHGFQLEEGGNDDTMTTYLATYDTEVSTDIDIVKKNTLQFKSYKIDAYNHSNKYSNGDIKFYKSDGNGDNEGEEKRITVLWEKVVIV